MGIQRTELICGKGNHSKEGMPKLKPSLLKALSDIPAIKTSEHESNPGRLVVHVQEEVPLYAALGLKFESISIEDREMDVGAD